MRVPRHCHVIAILWYCLVIAMRLPVLAVVFTGGSSHASGVSAFPLYTHRGNAMAVLRRTTSDETGSLWQVPVCWTLLHPWSPVQEWLRPQVRGGGICVLFVLRVYRRGMPGTQASRAVVLEAPESSWPIAIGTAFDTGGAAMAAFIDSMRRDRLLAQVLQTLPQRPIAGIKCLTQGT